MEVDAFLDLHIKVVSLIVVFEYVIHISFKMLIEVLILIIFHEDIKTSKNNKTFHLFMIEIKSWVNVERKLWKPPLPALEIVILKKTLQQVLLPRF